MSKSFITFLDTHYLKIFAGLMLVLIVGVTSFTLNKNKEERELSLSRRYFGIFGAQSEDGDPQKMRAALEQIRNDETGVYQDLAALSLVRPNEEPASAEINLKSIIESTSSNKILRDYAIYVLAKMHLANNDLKSFWEVEKLAKSKSMDFIFEASLNELRVYAFMAASDPKNALETLSVMQKAELDKDEAFKLMELRVRTLERKVTESLLRSTVEDIKEDVPERETKTESASISVDPDFDKLNTTSDNDYADIKENNVNEIQNSKFENQ